jgi:predicted amidohydrolase YtcJ
VLPSAGHPRTAGPHAVLENEQVVDGRGLFLLPGLHDAHVHMVQWATARTRLDVRAASSAAHAARLVRAAATAVTAATEDLLIGYGFRDALWPDRPDADLLEAAAPGIPVLLQSNDLHTAWVNRSALRLLGRDPRGDGVLREQDCYAAVAGLPQVGLARLDERAVAATVAAASRGVTSIMDFEYADTIADWSRRAQDRLLGTRITCVVAAHLVEEVAARRLRTGDVLADGHLRVGPMKLFADGSLNSRTAHCHEPYPDGSDAVAHAVGREELRRAVTGAAAVGLRPAVHAIGDAAVSLALDVLEELGGDARIEHAQLVAASDLHRFARPGLVTGVQPAHAPDDRDVADQHWPGRTGRAYAYADLHAAGARLEIGSDAPNAALDPWDGIASAVSRTDDDRPPWHPEQQLSLDVALAAASGGRARVVAGDPADLVLVTEDPWTLAPHDLRRIPVAATMTAGRWTHSAVDDVGMP